MDWREATSKSRGKKYWYIHGKRGTETYEKPLAVLSKEKYFSELNTHIDVNDICDVNRVVRRRINREPFSYIAKSRQFYGFA